MAVVMSVNGKITRGLDVSVMGWASKADKVFFKQMLVDNAVFIMGRQTYDVIKPQPNAAKLRVILTHNPGRYTQSEIPDQIEFTDNPPEIVIDNLADRGHENVLILGGSQIYGLFLEAGLITDVYITLESLIFGIGTDILSMISKNLTCRLVSSKIMNKQGTLLQHYKIV